MPARCQLGDPLDRRIESVGERELRDRLADDGDECLRAAERDLHFADPPAPPKCERRTDAERGELVEVGLDRAPFVEGEAENSGRGLAERNRVHVPRADYDRPGLPLVERAADALGGLDQVGRGGPEAVGGEQ